MAKKRDAGHTAHKGNKMTHAQAGHLGGVAHHKCRGRECEKHAEKAHKAKSNMWEGEDMD